MGLLTSTQFHTLIRIMHGAHMVHSQDTQKRGSSTPRELPTSSSKAKLKEEVAALSIPRVQMPQTPKATKAVKAQQNFERAMLAI